MASFSRRSSSATATTMHTWFSLLSRCLAVVLLFLGIAAALGIWHRDRVLVPALEKQFGFVTGTKYVPNGTLPKEMLYISSVKIGGEFERLGFLPGDIVLSHGRAAFYEALSKVSSGQNLELTIGRGDPFAGIDSLATQELTVSAPTVNAH